LCIAGQPRLRVALPCADLPELVINVMNGIQVGRAHYYSVEVTLQAVPSTVDAAS
jgi:hypothetical protein